MPNYDCVYEVTQVIWLNNKILTECTTPGKFIEKKSVLQEEQKDGQELENQPSLRKFINLSTLKEEVYV